VFRRFYHSISQSVGPDYPQFVDGLRQMQILDAVLASHTKRGWVDVPPLRTS
jgi:predicted dehydrogenase